MFKCRFFTFAAGLLRNFLIQLSSKLKLLRSRDNIILYETYIRESSIFLDSHLGDDF
jgi:hypothetical protein